MNELLPGAYATHLHIPSERSKLLEAISTLQKLLKTSPQESSFAIQYVLKLLFERLNSVAN